MPSIVGKFVDSGGVSFDGELVVKLDAPLVDVNQTPDALYTQAERSFAFTAASGGVLSGVNLVESATSNVSYYFRVNRFEQRVDYFLADGTQYTGTVFQHTDTYWYTGTFYDATQSQRLGRVVAQVPYEVMSFHAVVPNVASVDFASLIPTRVSTDSLPRTVRQIAELLTADPDFVQALRGGPRFQGAYSATTYYQRDDTVAYAGSSWLFLSTTPKINETPSTANTNWQLLAQKGDAGGTGGTNTVYDATGWLNAMWAPTANALRNIIETLARTSQLANYALLNNPIFGGSPSRSSNPILGDRSGQLPTTQWVGNEFATVNNTVLTGNPSSPNQLISDYSGKIANTKFVADFFANGISSYIDAPAFIAFKISDQTISTSGTSVLTFSTKTVDTHNAFAIATATFTAPIAGYYEFSAAVYLERVGGTQIDSTSLEILSSSNNYRLDTLGATSMNSFTAKGSVTIYLAQNATAALKLLLTLSGGASANNKNSYSNYFLTYFSGRKVTFS